MVFQLLDIFKNPIQIFNFNDDLIKPNCLQFQA